MVQPINLPLQKIKDLWLTGLSAEDILKEIKQGSTSSIKVAIREMKEGSSSIKISASETASRIDPSRTFKTQEAERAYTKLKETYSQELLDKTDEFTKSSKYKNLSQVENALFKYFNKSKYTLVPFNTRSKNAFFRPSDKIFNIPKEFKIYGGEFGKKRSLEKQSALRQIIGTKFFANSTLPKYNEIRKSMVEFYSLPESKREDLSAKAKNAVRKFNLDFSISRAVTKGNQEGIVNRFFNEKGFDFTKKIKDYQKIWTTKEGLQGFLKEPNLSNEDRIFYQRELDKLNKTDRGLLTALKERFPAMFKKDAAGGSMQLEHRVARAFGETQDMKLPKDYIARASYVPGRFNQAKYYNYDKPLMDLIAEYNTGDKSAKDRIKNLTQNFNKKSKGFLNNVKFNFTDEVKMTDSTPLFSRRSDLNVLKDIDKNIRSSDAYFKSFGSERIKGMPVGKVASDFVSASKDVKPFQKLVKLAEVNANNICSLVKTGNAAGGPAGCAAEISQALDEDPVGMGNKIKDLKVESGAVNRIKGAASAFLKFAGKGKVFGVTAAVGVGAGALVKEFRNDDPDTYLSNENQMKGMLVDTFEEDTLGKASIGGELAAAGLAVPGSKKVFDARKAKGFGAARSALGPLGKAASGFATPLGMGLTLPFQIASQLREGDSLEDIATSPLNYLAPAFAGTLTKEATVGMPKGGMLNKALRLGMSPAGVRGISKFFGLPGLALSLGYEGYDQYKKYQEEEGFLYNLLNKDD
jgi:hypothetical protein